MDEQIEIYVRDRSDGAMLNFYIPEGLRDSLLAALGAGAFTGDIALEMTIKPEWIIDTEQRKRLMEKDEPIHLRVPLKEIHI